MKRAFSLGRFPQVRRLRVSVPMGGRSSCKGVGDLGDLKRRVETTEKNLYIHMGSVDAMISCIDDCLSGKKIANTMRRLEELRNKIRIRDVKTIREKVDREYGTNAGNHRAKMSISLMRTRKRPITRKGILKSLVTITGKMAYFADSISKSLTSFKR
eukprot:TRINITY_DN7128_c0_g3_i1.p1 TRINITY_DN7128_c0_g3~~TRINITY_DN7128_c0_g3_i1.p1  ORF type:complete len:157 (+),score=15.26 TRINITY_DN7128_c0_g3_i1:438-908(+)